eukprot:7036103-Prymnesium_polylepis.1
MKRKVTNVLRRGSKCYSPYVSREKCAKSSYKYNKCVRRFVHQYPVACIRHRATVKLYPCCEWFHLLPAACTALRAQHETACTVR